jgi:ribosomal-protein-alanine N-acetyltransferase
MNTKDLCVLKMTAQDIEHVALIEKTCFSIPWSKQQFEDELLKNSHAHYHVIKLNDQVIGYMGLWKIFDEGHITNIAVLPDYRRSGVASFLLKHVFSFCIEQDIRSLTLEVRKSNTPAIELYKKHGFTESGFRKAYYSDNNEDAIIMWKNDIN